MSRMKRRSKNIGDRSRVSESEVGRGEDVGEEEVASEEKFYCLNNNKNRNGPCAVTCKHSLVTPSHFTFRHPLPLQQQPQSRSASSPPDFQTCAVSTLLSIMDDDRSESEAGPQKARKTSLSDNVNTARDRKRRADMTASKRDADNQRKADNAARTRARKLARSSEGFEDLSPSEQDARIQEAISRIDSKR